MLNPIAKIHLGNISHNLQQIKLRVPNAKIMAVVKADAYGHGAVRVAQYLDTDKNVDAYAVSRFPEAMELHSGNIKKPILLLEGIIDQEQLKETAKLGFWCVVQDQFQLDLISNTSITQPLNIWLKFDTGMHRLGFDVDDLDNILNNIHKLIKYKKIQPNCTVLSHFACADDLNNNFSIQQLEKFSCITNKINSRFQAGRVEYSLANSAGIFGWPDSHYDWVRPGISLYGSSPLLGKSTAELNLKPTMELISKIISLKILKTGEYVGYGASWQAKKESLIAIISCGYADCYPRVLGTPVFAWINNKKCDIIGRISMDMIAVDCSIFHNSKLELNIGDSVELWGPNILVDKLADSVGTIANELYCRVTSRVIREYEV